MQLEISLSTEAHCDDEFPIRWQSGSSPKWGKVTELLGSEMKPS